MVPRGLQFVPAAFIGPFLIFHGLLASSYLMNPEPWGTSRFGAMFSPLLEGKSIHDDPIEREFFHFWVWFSTLLGCLRLYAGAGVINGQDERIRMAQLSYAIESVCYIPLQMRGVADPLNTFLPAWATIFGLVVMAFRVKPQAPLKVD